MNNGKIVVALDLHAVAFDFSYEKLLSGLYAFFKKEPLYNLSLLNPVFGYRLWHELRNSSMTAENIYTVLEKKYYPGLAGSKNEFFDICNAYDINPEMEALVAELKGKGYHVAVCSNIGKDAFKEFCRLHTTFFGYCDVLVTSEPEDNYIRKPALPFFEKFKERCAQQLGDGLVFFFADDKIKNIKAAQKAGINSCLFKKPAQFREYLKQQGLELE
jgi:FMN phosphatase YigB (HAD superfamily)